MLNYSLSILLFCHILGRRVILSTNLILNLLFIFSLLQLFARSAIAEDGKKDEETPSSEVAKFEPNSEYDRTSRYVNKWLSIPALGGARLDEEGDLNYQHLKGRMVVFVFLASWSEPAQNMMKDLIKIEKKYEEPGTDFFYIFAHDTRSDAEGFIKHFKLGSSVMANNQILSDFKIQQLPTIIVGDRHGWLTQIYQNVKSQDLEDLEGFLKLQTAL